MKKKVSQIEITNEGVEIWATRIAFPQILTTITGTFQENGICMLLFGSGMALTQSEAKWEKENAYCKWFIDFGVLTKKKKN